MLCPDLRWVGNLRMNTGGSLQIFANPRSVACGWYWALPSTELRKGDKRELDFLGEDLLLYRSESGKVYCVQAYCPHMGANLKEGRIEGEDLRCAFHGWKHSGAGRCVSTACSSEKVPAASVPRRKSHLVAEKFGMIWIHTHADSEAPLESIDPLPDFPALAGSEVIARVDQSEIRNCHPTLILGGGVDEEHFSYVHSQTTDISGPLRFDFQRVSPAVIRYENKAEIKQTSVKSRMMHRLYRGVLRYGVTYWYGSTALAELGPPMLPLYSLFCYRPMRDGRTEGLNIYVTRARRGPIGKLISFIALYLTRKILRNGGSEDAVIQNSIRFAYGPYASGNAPFAEFVRYVEEQPYIDLATREVRSCIR